MARIAKGNSDGNGTRGEKEKVDPRPYFEWGSAYYRNPIGGAQVAGLNDLVGFAVHETQRKLWAWLKPFYRDNDKRISGLTRAETIKLEAIQSVDPWLRSLTWMHGPERIAELRWFEALSELQKSVKRFTPFAVVREAEDSFFEGKLHGDATSKERATAATSHTREIREMAEALAKKAKECQQKITEWMDDPLPGLKQKKRHRHFLATIEASLSIAGFGPAEIAELVIDNQRKREGNGVRAQLAHRERIATRIRSKKTKLVATTRDGELRSASLKAFKKRTGQSLRSGETGKVYRGWLDSPEYAELEAQLAEEKGGRKPMR